MLHSKNDPADLPHDEAPSPDARMEREREDITSGIRAGMDRAFRGLRQGFSREAALAWEYDGQDI